MYILDLQKKFSSIQTGNMEIANKIQESHLDQHCQTKYKISISNIFILIFLKYFLTMFCLKAISVPPLSNHQIYTIENNFWIFL